MRLHIHDTLAIGVDYQERLIPAIQDKETLIRNSRLLFSGLEILGVPVVVSRQYPKGLGDTVPEIREVTVKATVLDKLSFSCYQDSAIKQTVDAAGRRTVVLSGTEAHVCVLQTAIDLREAGFRVVLVADCAGSRRSGDKEYGLRRAAGEGAILVSYEQLLFELLAGASSPGFKALSALLK
ncbi:MAG: hydrolase [Desulfovibrio sp.]|jgi:nicotinamidase-related amidase|nr:hydrolase [Desulfovibrio sp.]